MSLTYTTRRTTVEVVEKEVKVPSGFAMYTKSGDRRLAKDAQKLLDTVESVTKHEDDYSKRRSWYRKAFASYFKSYRKATESNAKNMEGASDTAVRECVWCFALQVANAIDFSESRLDDLWDDYS